MYYYVGRYMEDINNVSDLASLANIFSLIEDTALGLWLYLKTWTSHILQIVYVYF